MPPIIQPPVPERLEEDAASPAYEVDFWRRPWVQAAVPWMTSLSVHLGILALALILLTSGAFDYVIQKVTQAQVTVPTTDLAETNIGQVPNVGHMDDVTSPNAQLDPVEQSRNFLPEGDETGAMALAEPGGSPAPADSITGITGVGSLRDALGGGGGEGSTIFGESGGGGKFMGFDIGREGDGGEVYRVAFVCDASGSMSGMPQTLLVEELKRAIGPLKPVQFFNVIFFQSDEVNAAFPGRLESANPMHKEQTHQFLDNLVVRGSTNPIPALEAAFRMKPELIFFLTDGRFDQIVKYDDVAETFRRLNSDEKVIVNTIQFINRDELAEGVLRTIAHENGGEYRFVGRDDL